MHETREKHVNRVIQKRANREMNERNARNGTNANCGNHVVIEGYRLPHVLG